jgi:sulfatase maturation enzyme AslB (radical SAM superfamily)
MGLTGNNTIQTEKAQTDGSPQALSWKLWLYTNYDCNLSCSYCVAESTPAAT